MNAELDNATARIFISVGVGAIDDPFYEQFNPTPRRENDIILNVGATIGRPPNAIINSTFCGRGNPSPTQKINTAERNQKSNVLRVVDGADPYRCKSATPNIEFKINVTAKNNLSPRALTLHSAFCTHGRSKPH